ncbi:MAG: hypothetical protein HRU09_21245 [Oligoflexales bacterium]|nr:hypothetical protein [Oligoflexales bacterium]
MGNLRKVLVFGEDGEYFAGNEYQERSDELLEIDSALFQDYVKESDKEGLNDFTKSKQGKVSKFASDQIRLIRSIWNIDEDAKLIGYVVLEFSTAEVRERLLTIATRLGIFTLFLCLGIIILAQLFIHALIIKRVKSLEKVSIEVSKRNYVTLEDDRRKDELASLSNNFNQMVTELKDYSSNLEQKVKERTQEVVESKKQIQDILDNIQQGILTFGADNLIHEDFSKFLAEIYEVCPKSIMGLNMIDFCLKSCDMDEDSLDSVEGSLMSIIGQSMISWELNEHLLSREGVLELPKNKKKNLAFDWMPVTDEGDDIIKIMLSVRDVTLQNNLKKKWKVVSKSLINW